MQKIRKSSLGLFLSIGFLIGMGGLIGNWTRPEVMSWYMTLDRSPWTPPGSVFSIVWTILYALLGYFGWEIWRYKEESRSRELKLLYILHLFLNWSWSPLFFKYQCIGNALLCLIAIDLVMARLIILTHGKVGSSWYGMLIYYLWIAFATYLNLYIWIFN